MSNLLLGFGLTNRTTSEPPCPNPKQEAHQLAGPGETRTDQLENLQLGVSCAFGAMQINRGPKAPPTEDVKLGASETNSSRDA